MLTSARTECTAIALIELTMSRRPLVPYHLYAAGIKSLPMADIRVILRGADELIGVGGRTLLTKILKGSRAKDVLSRNLDQSPAYGMYRDLPVDEVHARIDWTILQRYLRIEYAGQLPVLAYTPAGWEIERETVVDEIVQGFDKLLANASRPYDMLFLKDRNREVIWRVLDKIQASGERKYLPVLEDWGQVDYRKVRQRISEVIQDLTPRAA